MSPEVILDFWFSDRVRPLWFRSTPEFDTEVRTKFLDIWEAASRGELSHWGETPLGALALIIVLDQFPLNMFRGRSESFATEAKALQVARRAVASGWDEGLTDEQKGFLYLPFMHSESQEDQETSVRLYEKAGLAESLKWAHHHRDLIGRFGRFPHRNVPLGRESTPEETAYLQSEQAYHG